MSLINDMLRDLDTRNAATSERSGLANNVRALPASPGRRFAPLWLAIGAAVLGGGLVWLLLRPTTPPVAAFAPQPTIPQAPVTVPDSPPDVAQASGETFGTTSTSELPSAIGSAEAPATLRLDTQINTQLPSPAALAGPEKPVVVPAPPTPQAPVTTPVKAAASPPAVESTTAVRTVDLAPSRSNAPPQISKQPVNAGSSNELAETEYRRAIAALRRGDINEGSDALRSALRLSPTHIGARQALLGTLSEQQRWMDVETLALDGVGVLPQRSDWALLAARIMYERNEPEQALETLNQNAAAGRLNTDYQILHALLLQRAGRHADAAKCYRAALALRPNEGRWWYGLGRALDADKRDAEARQAYEKARGSGNLPAELQQAVEGRLR